MSTRCSVIIIQDESKPLDIVSHDMALPVQFYHHHDGYLSGVGAELFAFMKNGINDEFFSLKELPNSYEKEDIGDIHGDWAYFYIVKMNYEKIEFFYLRKFESLRGIEKDDEYIPKTAVEFVDACLLSQDAKKFGEFRIKRATWLKDTNASGNPKPYLEGEFFDSREVDWSSVL